MKIIKLWSNLIRQLGWYVAAHHWGKLQPMCVGWDRAWVILFMQEAAVLATINLPFPRPPLKVQIHTPKPRLYSFI